MTEGSMMSEAPLPCNEDRRLAALLRLGILDSPPEEQFDRIVAKAAAMADAPISLISFVTDTRQWFKASVGLEVKENDRGAAFCAWAIYNAEVLCIEDARNDARFYDNAFVTGGPNIRSYVGAPIQSPDGFLLGTLCVIDNKPRVFDPSLVEGLTSLAAEVSGLLESWRRHDDERQSHVQVEQGA